jgi:hypothetical protein
MRSRIPGLTFAQAWERLQRTHPTSSMNPEFFLKFFGPQPMKYADNLLCMPY